MTAYFAYKNEQSTCFREATLGIVLIGRRGPDQIEQLNDDCSCQMLRRCIPRELDGNDKKQRCDFRRCLAITDEVRFRNQSEADERAIV